eukprot:768272-Hanusia_phi.AAC.10
MPPNCPSCLLLHHPESLVPPLLVQTPVSFSKSSYFDLSLSVSLCVFRPVFPSFFLPVLFLSVFLSRLRLLGAVAFPDLSRHGFAQAHPTIRYDTPLNKEIVPGVRSFLDHPYPLIALTTVGHPSEYEKSPLLFFYPPSLPDLVSIIVRGMRSRVIEHV